MRLTIDVAALSFGDGGQNFLLESDGSGSVAGGDGSDSNSFDSCLCDIFCLNGRSGGGLTASSTSFWTGF